MKNVIMLILDSFSYYEYEYAKERKNIIPFLTELEKKTIFASNVYAQGPHSEVGVRGLVCGCNTLDFGGSSRFFSEAKSTVFDVFLKENYDVSYIVTPVIYVPERLRHNNNFHQYYTVAYKFLYLWRNRLDYWAGIYSQRKLSNHEKESAINLCKDAFEVTYAFWKDADEKRGNTVLVEKKLQNVDTALIVSTIVNEKKKFDENRWEYVKAMFMDFHNNILARMTDINENQDVDNNFIDYIKNENRAFLNKLKRRQIINNIFLDRYTIREIEHGIRDRLKNKRNDNLKSYDEWIRRLRSANEFELHIQEQQYVPPSIKKQLNLTLEILKNRTNRRNDKPCFIYLQPEELHYHNNWFTYDIIDEKNIEKEFRDLKRVFSKRKDREKGYLTQSLALNYVDRCLEEFFMELRSNNLLDDTIVLITADHGSSYGHAPIRNALSFNNLFSENYHIPLFIYNQGKTERVDKLLMSCDIVPILLEMLNINNGQFARAALDKEREIVHSEYMGPGYQDLLGKEIWFSARDSNYKINYIVRLFGEFSDGKLEAVYDIRKDPKELRNLVKSSYDHEDIKRLLNYLEKRRIEIQVEQNDYNKE